MTVYNLFIYFREQAIEWCRGRNWWWRLPLLLWLGYVLVRHLADPLYSSILGGLNLGIHELGHLVFSFLGETLTVAGGTLLQLLIPVFGIFNFYRQRDFFSIALCFGWLSTNLFSVATYAADARRLELPLVTPFGGEEVIHDWEFLLSKWNILEYDTLIAQAFRATAVFSMILCFSLGGWLLWTMATQRSPSNKTLKHSSP